MIQVQVKIHFQKKPSYWVVFVPDQFLHVAVLTPSSGEDALVQTHRAHPEKYRANH